MLCTRCNKREAKLNRKQCEHCTSVDNAGTRRRYKNPATRARILARNKTWRTDNPEKKHASDANWRNNNREQHRENSRRWQREHKAHRRVYFQDRYDNNIDHRLAVTLRNRLYQAVKSDQKTGSAIRDLGCSIPAFRLYIENQFEDDMTWDNYGEWHLDHVIPLASFDLTNRGEFQTAVHYLNIQPMWALDNAIKGASL
jgi:hypothetical protein